MPHADVVVIGAGLSGLVAATRLAEAGAIVTLVAKGHASTHWGSGRPRRRRARRGAAPRPRASRASPRWTTRTASSPRTSRRPWPGCSSASRRPGSPTPGTLDTPIRRVPTAIGGTRRVAIVPAAQAAALRPWDPDELLVVAGIAGFKDFWPAAIADSLGREAVWMGSDRPATSPASPWSWPGIAGAQQPQRPAPRPALRRPRAARRGHRRGSPAAVKRSPAAARAASRCPRSSASPSMPRPGPSSATGCPSSRSRSRSSRRASRASACGGSSASASARPAGASRSARPSHGSMSRAAA